MMGSGLSLVLMMFMVSYGLNLYAVYRVFNLLFNQYNLLLIKYD